VRQAAEEIQMPFSNQCCFVTRSFEQSGKSHGAVVDLPSWVAAEIFCDRKGSLSILLQNNKGS
jgi:hypothetical protein